MFAGMSRRRLLFMLITFILMFCVTAFSLADVLMPEASGKKVQKDGGLVVDSSHADDGYVMVKVSKKVTKRVKVRVTAGQGTALNYDLNGDGDFEVYPLQFGRINYTVGLFVNQSGNKYKAAGKVTVSPKGMTDELSCFLYPNQYVNYTADSPCVAEAIKLCGGMTDQEEIYKAVCNFVKTNFAYDFIKSVTVKPGQLPDIQYCWDNKMGICQDLSALTCAMLRSQGVPARLIIGTLGSGTPHAWVLAVVNGEDKFFDPTAELNASSKTDTYTTERWY